MSASTSRVVPLGGMPILSGPPPITESPACRQCGKEFNPLWRRSHPCGHCGYEYCSACLSDGQALMPRKSGESSTSSSSGMSGAFSAIKEELGIGPEKRVGSGYEVESVCLHCLSMLQITAAPVAILRSLPIKRLKDYLAAYDIPYLSPREKEDFVQAVVNARRPGTGCLSPEAESYYRRKSVPKLGQPTKAAPTTSAPARPAQARPPPPVQGRFASPTPLNRPPQPHARPPQPQTQARPPPPQPHYHPPQYHPYPTPPAPRPQVRPPPRSTPATPVRQPSPPVPTILSLVSLPKSYLSTLSIGTLKAVLYENHVKVDFSQVLEKAELVNRVSELIVDERKRLERQRLEEEREASGSAVHVIGNGAEREGSGEDVYGESEGAAKRVPTGPVAEVERGLCVVCQDEEATLAVVDCGHLAMCAHCSDLIMATSQECPLCRTRIVTPQRLIRIYRV